MFPNIPGKDISKENPQIQIYGQRIFRDQTIYEYLLEFLLVFVSPKETTSDNGFSLDIDPNRELAYFPTPRMGLKRFIFLSRSSKDKRFNADVKALNDHKQYLMNEMDLDNDQYDQENVLEILQDLLYGFNAVVGKRSWFAQSLLPVAPELIFCEAIGRKSDRQNIKLDSDEFYEIVDTKFNFNDRVFMARGGEVYYLHISQGVQDDKQLKASLENGIKELITSYPVLSSLATGLQCAWDDAKNNQYNLDINNRTEFIKKTCEWIPSEYEERAIQSCKELNNLLSAELIPFKKIDLMATLIVFQLLRLMCNQASIKTNQKRICWLVDVNSKPTSQIRKLSISSYKEAEETLFRALYSANIDSYISESNRLNEDVNAKIRVLDDAAKDSSKLLRKLGKEIGLVIPYKGKDMRFSLNEHLIMVLVQVLVPPGEKVLFSKFLKDCYNHFGLVIGPNEAILHYDKERDLNLFGFDENEKGFSELMKKCGFLRDLSDATAIVENPYK